jgi:predicted permease
MQDLRFALRSLRNNRGFTAASIATLALAIGVNTAMFSVLDTVLLRPLPYRAPEQLAMLWTEVPNQQLREGRSAYRNVEEWRRQSRSFTDLAVFDPVSIILSDVDGAERITAARISPSFLPLLGVEPVRGRSFSVEEAEQRHRVALISHRFWQSRLAGSADAIGASIEVDGLTSRIVGILPAGFRLGGLEADVWEPHTLFPDWEARRGVAGAASWFVIGRLRPNVTVPQAQAEMNAIADRIDQQVPLAARSGISVVPLSQHIIGARSRLAVWLLTGAVFCVLLVAAANVAGLSLARGVGRAREIAIRTALGASVARIVRQLLVENATLAALSGLLGTLIAIAAMRVLRAVAPGDLPRLDEVGLDPRVLGWALLISLVTAVLVGLAPAITMSRRSLQPSSKDGGRGVTGGVATRGIRRALVVGEFALAIVLLIGAGLLIRSWLRLEGVDPGFKPERVLSLQLGGPASGAPEQRADFYHRVLEQVESLPGVQSAGVVGDLFVSGNPERLVTREGEAGAGPERVRFRRDDVSARLFSTLGVPLLRGRFFTTADGPQSPRVAIVNEVMARRLWPGRDPVGSKFKLGPAGSRAPWFTVVGVVGDMRRQGLENEPIPQMFEPLAQNPSRFSTLLVRTSLEDPLKLVAALRAAVRRVETRAPVYGVTTLDNRLDASLGQRRFQTGLLIGFSLVALLLAALGIYGLIHYSIATRTREIGIRLAVGAQAGDIFRMIIGEGLRLSLTGLLLGLVGAWWLVQAGSSLLFGVTPTDPLTFLAVSLLLTVVATAACFFPARRAMKVDPIVAMQQD